LAVPKVNAESEHGGDEKDVDVDHGGRARDIEVVLQEGVDNGESQRDEGSLEQREKNLGSNELIAFATYIAESEKNDAEKG
jgi:hypothetical protein